MSSFIDSWRLRDPLDVEPGGHVDVQGVGVLGVGAGIAGATVVRTAPDTWEVTVALRGGVAAGEHTELAQGMATATLGGTVTTECHSRAQVVRALTRPWVKPIRATASLQVDALAIADPLPAEVRASLTGKIEMAWDKKTGILTQRMEMDPAGLAEGLIEGAVGDALIVKAESDRAAVSGTARLALEYRFESRDGELLHAKRLGPPELVGSARLSVGNTAVTATQRALLSELPRFFEPRRLRYTVERTWNAQFSAIGGAGPVSYRLVASRTEPVYRAEDIPFDRLRSALAAAP